MPVAPEGLTTASALWDGGERRQAFHHPRAAPDRAAFAFLGHWLLHAGRHRPVGHHATGQGVRASGMQRRRYGTPTKFSGIYRVDRVDTTVPDGFRVTLTDVATGKEVSASLQDAIVSEDHRALIRQAEWNKSRIRVQMSARLLRNRFVDAVVLSVEAVSSEPTAADD